MIRRLRIKFIATAMGVLLIVFAIIFLTINIFMQYSSNWQTERLLEMVAEQDGLPALQRDQPGKLPPPGDNHAPRPEMMRANRFFFGKVDVDGNVFEMRLDMMFEFSAEEASEYITRALSHGGNKGSIDQYQYLTAEKSYGKIIVFAEKSIEMRMLDDLLRVSSIVAAISFVILSGLIMLLSGWAIRPVRESFEKQRRFVSDAGHELKTPLTILSANADVLRAEIGENPSLSAIETQSGRMNRLIQDLLTLARADEGQAEFVFAQFGLSEAALGVTLEFESLAFEEGKTLSYEIGENIRMQGDEGRMRQMLAILIDNAVKHSDENGQISVSLASEGGRTALSVYNTGSGIPSGEYEKVFERFYRSDASRSRETGGYGLGLAIAKSIAEAHKGRIQVAGESGEWVRFTVALPSSPQTERRSSPATE